QDLVRIDVIACKNGWSRSRTSDLPLSINTNVGRAEMKGASMLSGGRRCACECPMVFRPQLAYRSANRSPLLSRPMHTPDQIGMSALPRSLRAPGAVRRRFGRFELDEVKGCSLRDGK